MVHGRDCPIEVPQLGLATLSRALLSGGAAPAALDAARAAMDLLEAHGGFEDGEALVRLVLVEALEASGDLAAARSAAESARARLLARAGRVSDDSWRESFLARVPDNARTLELFRRLTGS